MNKKNGYWYCEILTKMKLLTCNGKNHHYDRRDRSSEKDHRNIGQCRVAYQACVGAKQQNKDCINKQGYQAMQNSPFHWKIARNKIVPQQI
jgi:hypothetical protein